jgi:hypothetical protein
VPPYLGSTLLASDPSPFLRDGAFHQQHNEHKRDHDNGQHPEHVEVGERRCLLLAQVGERLQRQLLRGDRIAGLLQERSGSLIKEGTRSRIEGIEPFAKAEAMELVTATWLVALLGHVGHPLQGDEPDGVERPPLALTGTIPRPPLGVTPWNGRIASEHSPAHLQFAAEPMTRVHGLTTPFTRKVGGLID